jgi:hypothetical protein
MSPSYRDNFTFTASFLLNEVICSPAISVCFEHWDRGFEFRSEHGNVRAFPSCTVLPCDMPVHCPRSSKDSFFFSPIYTLERDSGSWRERRLSSFSLCLSFFLSFLVLFCRPLKYSAHILRTVGLIYLFPNVWVECTARNKIAWTGNNLCLCSLFSVNVSLLVLPFPH